MGWFAHVLIIHISIAMYRLGYDAKRLFNNFTGLGNYSRTLLKDLAAYYPDNAYFLYTPRVTKNQETQFFLNSPLFHVHEPKPGAKLFWRTSGLKRDLNRHRIQLYHGLSHEIPIGMAQSGIPAIVTIHDLIFYHYPNQYAWADRQIYDFKFGYACRNAQHVVATSESTKQDIINFYNIPPEKITVIYQSVHERFVQERSQKTIDAVLAKYQLPENYLLFVGSLIERKNLLGVVQALHQLPPADRLPLVIVGQGEPYKRLVLAYARSKGLLHLLHFIKPDFADFPALYQQADVFLYPSYYEGFGIPLLEALFSQVPVITSKTSSLPEAAGPDAWLVDPSRPEEIAAGIQAILHDEDLRKRMITNGYQHATRFRGDRLATEMMELYEQFLG